MSETGSAYMNLLTTFLVLCLLGAFAFPTAQIGVAFTSERQSIQHGQETTLHWKVSGAESVFISGIGSVSAEGTKVVRPETSTEYTLIAEGASINSVTKLKISVEGGRGDDDYPKDLDRFKYPIRLTKTASSLPEQLGRIHTILQDEMSFSVKEFQTNEGFFFLTNSSQRDHLVDNSERRIRARYISYLVKVGKPDGASNQVSIVISSMIEYIRGGESTRRLEMTDTLYRQEAERLRAKINGSQ